MNHDAYAGLARLYDPATAWALAGLRREISSQAATARRTAGGGIVADICCGTGVLARMLAKAGLQAVGLDLSPAMLAMAGAAQNALLVRANATALPLVDGSAGCAVLCLALHENPPAVRAAMLAEAARVLRPGGALLLADYLAPKNGRERLARLWLHPVERMAGRDHYRGFLDFLERGGAEGAALGHGWRVESVSRHVAGAVGLVVARPGR